MLCDICHKNPATVHLTEIINDKVMEMHICQKCAKSKTEELKGQLNVFDFLGGLVGVEESAEERLKCSFCGLTYKEFREKGKFGCENCYVTFRQRLLLLFKKIHGSSRHVGKNPSKKGEKISDEVKLKGLRERLEKAIATEEYEEAARLRDELKKIEGNKNV